MEWSQLPALDQPARALLSLIPPELFGVCHLSHYPAGSMVVNRGAPVAYAFFILTGEFATYSATTDGKMASSMSIPAPDLISDLEILARQPVYATNVMAPSDTLALLCPSADFDAALTAHPDFLREISCYCARRSFRVSFQQSGTAFHTGLEKVAIFLIHEYAAHPVPPGDDMVLRWTRPMMASKIVVSQKTVDRGVYELRDRGYLTLLHGKIHVSTAQYARLLTDWWEADTLPTQAHPANRPEG